MDFLGDTAAILNSIVSNNYYRMLRGQIHTSFPPPFWHPIRAIETIEFKMPAVSSKKIYLHYVQIALTSDCSSISRQKTNNGSTKLV